jgi:hypothetical protein
MELQIAEALWNAAHAHGNNGLELEFRIGHALPGGHFSPNVGRDQFAKLKAVLDASSSFKKYEIETVEKVGNGTKHVTTLKLSRNDEDNPPPPSYCMTKTKVFQRDFAVDECPYTVRCGIAIEKVIGLTQIPARVTRHKRRHRYVHKAWAFDLTTVVSNGDVDTEETYEVEIELLDTDLVFEKTMDHIAASGLSLVRDCISMLQNKM